MEGGLFYVDPTQAGGAGNSLDTKCDLSVKKDAAGTVLARWLPSYNYADFSMSPEFSMMGNLFPAGQIYNGKKNTSILSPRKWSGIAPIINIAGPPPAETGSIPIRKPWIQICRRN